MFKPYDVVTIKKVIKNYNYVKYPFNKRRPAFNDTAKITKVYSKPLGYELECCNGRGKTEWLLSFAANEIELELISSK